jgi:hypothetical protein
MKIVQFLHPGGEQSRKNGSVWNLGKHKRKFIKAQGTFLDQSNNFSNQTLGFWGEWEAPSTYQKLYNNENAYPKYITEAYYDLTKTKHQRRSTDPFVFGNQFYYSICQQGHSPQLRNLNFGDIILFGSRKQGRFILDTLFVVNDHFPYKRKSIKNLKSEVNDIFYDVTLKPISKSAKVKKVDFLENNGKYKPYCDDYEKVSKCIIDEADEYRVYKGLMYKDREKLNNVFSFVPAVILDKEPNGFARPNIFLDKIITQNLTQGFKVTSHSKEEGIEIWQNITKQVFEQGLGLMLECDLPGVKSNT